MVKELRYENADIGFKNFEGREGMYNQAGERSFVVFLDYDQADELSKQGWNIKYPKPNPKIDPSEDDRRPYLPIGVSFDNYPANVYLITDNNTSKLEGDEAAMLDWAELESVDLVIRPYEWTMNGKSGVKAYLRAGYFKIVTDPFADKYGI